MRWYPRVVGTNRGLYTTNEQLLRHFRYQQPVSGLTHTFGVEFGAEQQHAAIGRSLGFQALKTLLRVMQRRGAFVD